MENIIPILLGIGLSVATGFRVFLPFLIVSALSLLGFIQISDNFSWIGTTPALITFGLATIIEVVAYLIPWIDNALDTISIPLSIIAGTILMVSVTTELSPLIQWVLAIITGGSIAGIIKTGASITRLTSSLTTGGIGNSAVSTVESGLSIGITLLAVFIPIIAGLLVILILVWIILKFRKKLLTRIVNH
jgi:hypothetical protein